jgi:hypothetical protein
MSEAPSLLPTVPAGCNSASLLTIHPPSPPPPRQVPERGRAGWTAGRAGLAARTALHPTARVQLVVPRQPVAVAVVAVESSVCGPGVRVGGQHPRAHVCNEHYLALTRRHARPETTAPPPALL